ncbi:uncharacterized protein LOC116121174 [Pistacia vera]|uniref:uncharacterized protein LOC116121174 n=1 Tax=Pistacia vera TaxID=55513 RepID=UPI001262DA6F|nr:uncharacterized protein LOC116121174 [Pistacia vera]
MEGALSLDSCMILERLHGFEGLQGLMQLHHHQDPHFYQHGSMIQQQTGSVSLLNVQSMQVQPISVTDCDIDERGQRLVRDDYLRNFSEADVNEHNEVGEGTEKQWQRIKWTEQMVKLLITTVSYIGQYASSVVGSGRQESSVLQKIGKWRLVSNVMVERGYNVSPQQCEDKFNNLNKSYKRLNEVFGQGFSCKVVENPKLLDEMSISEKERKDVRKILCSKQLFYEEMCSYHNGNQLYLAHDPDLQRYWQLALRKKDKFESHPRCSKANDFDERVEDAGADGRANETEDVGGISAVQEVSVTRDVEAVNPLNFVGVNGLDKQYQDNETFDIDGVLGVSEASGKRLEKVNRDVYPSEFVGFKGTSQDHQQQSHTDLNHISPKVNHIDELLKRWMAFRSCRIRVQRLHVKAQLLKLEKQRFKWQRIWWKQDREMKKMRLENETLKIENERMEMELEFKRLRADYSLGISI